MGVFTGRTSDDVEEALNTDAAKMYAITVSAEVWSRHGVQHPLGPDFTGLQDFQPQALDEQTALSCTAHVPQSLQREIYLTGTPDDVIEQAAVWRDHGVRYAVVVNASAMQPSLRKGMTSSLPFAKVMRGLRKL